MMKKQIIDSLDGIELRLRDCFRVGGSGKDDVVYDVLRTISSLKNLVKEPLKPKNKRNSYNGS